MAAYAAAAGHEVKVIDAFALAPRQRHDWQQDYELFGLLPDEAMEMVGKDAELVGISAHSGTSHRYVLELIRRAKERGLKTVAGGPFASTLPQVFLSGAGADYVVIGEGEKKLVELVRGIAKGDISGISGLASAAGVQECREWIEVLGRDAVSRLQPD